MKIGIIGTAGRLTDAKRLTAAHFEAMCRCTEDVLREHQLDIADRDLVSGGAAWADHVAVRLYLLRRATSLTLHLPASFYRRDSETRASFLNTADAWAANRCHKAFSSVIEQDSLAEIELALSRGACHTVSNGFKARNLRVAQCDMLIAYTFGDGDAPKDGGTRHTWDHSTAPTKIHIPLRAIL